MKKLVSLFTFLFFISMKVILASNAAKIPFRYNVLPTTKAFSIVDTNAQKELEFQLFSEGETIYYENKIVPIQDGRFVINVASLAGQKTIQFQNEEHETATFTYYFSKKDGKVENYELVKNKKLDVYVTTIQGIQIIYTKQEAKTIQKLKQYFQVLPPEILANVKTITLIPYSNTSKIAGTAKEKDILLYQFSKYSSKTQMNILFHEMAHLWANHLMQERILDYSYTQYQEVVKLDKNYVSQYSHQYLQENGKYSEDFADSVAFYFINPKAFAKKYPHRSEWIEKNLV